MESAFFQFLFLAFLLGPPFGEWFVAGLAFEAAAKSVDFFTGKGFLLPTGHNASVRRKSFGVNRHEFRI